LQLKREEDVHVDAMETSLIEAEGKDIGLSLIGEGPSEVEEELLGTAEAVSSLITIDGEEGAFMLSSNSFVTDLGLSNDLEPVPETADFGATTLAGMSLLVVIERLGTAEAGVAGSE